MDGTVLDGGYVTVAILNTCQIVAASRPQLDVVELAKANIAAFDEVWEERHEDWTLGRISDSDFREECWSLTLYPFGIRDEIEILSIVKLFSHFVRDTYFAFDDVAPLVDAVNKAGIPVGLVTNGASGVQRTKVESIGLLDWFDGYAVSGELGVAKPDAMVFQPLLESFRLEGKSVWHVGDNIDADVAGANNAGLTSVWLNRDEKTRDDSSPIPDLEISSLRELIQHLK